LEEVAASSAVICVERFVGITSVAAKSGPKARGLERTLALGRQTHVVVVPFGFQCDFVNGLAVGFFFFGVLPVNRQTGSSLTPIKRSPFFLTAY
jgi:hypothetical protein